MAERRSVLYDPFGNEVRSTVRPPAAPQAAIGRVRDPWLGSSIGEVTPELAAAVLRGNAPLRQQMALARWLLSDDHVYSCMRNLIRATVRLPLEIQAFDESATAEKDAELAREFFGSMRFLRKLMRFLVFGEFFTFVAAEKIVNSEYGIDGFDPINPVRWERDDTTNSLRLLTLRSRTRGEPLEDRKNGWIFHQGELEPGTQWDAGLWRKCAWLVICKKFSRSYLMRFAQNYGLPWVMAFISRPEDEESVLEAVTELNANARGVFPVGTEIKLQEAQRYGTTNLFDAITSVSEAGLTKLIQGHVLNMDAKSGTGTLAGEHAERVSQSNLEGVAEGISETMQNDLLVPWAEWHFGEEQVRRGEIPTVVLKADPPKDEQKKAQVFVSANQALASVGLAVDPAQIEDDLGVRTVPLVNQVDPGEDPDDDSAEPERKRRAAKRRLIAASKPPRIRTKDDTEKVTEQLVARAAREFSEQIADIVARADSLEEAADAMWEGYRTLQTVALGSALRDATLTAHLQGRGDAGADS